MKYKGENGLSDHGELIDSVIDKIDSEIVAGLVQKRLDRLKEKEMDAVKAIYGDCFLLEKKTKKQYAAEIGVTPSAISSRIGKAIKEILQPKSAI